MKKNKPKKLITEKKARVNGIACLLFASCEDREIKPRKDYPHKYYLRHSDCDWDKPITVEKFVLVNRFGVILSKEPFDLKEECAKIKSFKILWDRSHIWD